MSRQEIHIGNLRMIGENLPTFKDKVKYLKDTLHLDLSKWEGDLEEEYLPEDLGYFFMKDKVFKIENHISGDEYVCFVERTGKNRYLFFLNYHNGGCEFNEALEKGLEDLEKKEKS